MAANAVLDERVTTLLRDATEWRLLSRLLDCPSPEWRDDISRLSEDAHSSPLKAMVQSAQAQASEGLYHSVFGPGGPAPPREASYHASVELGSLLSAIAGAYAAFAYQPETDEPVDHIAVETGFIAYLRLKEAYAFAAGDDAAAGLAQRTAERFLTDHIAVSAHTLAELLANSGIDYLARASAMVAERSGPKPKGRTLPVIQPAQIDEDEDGAFACGPT
jgi:TorA maturation chaperone TorD